MKLKDTIPQSLLTRRKRALNPYNHGEKQAGECALELGSLSALAIVLGLFSLGYFLMHSYLINSCAAAAADAGITPQPPTQSLRATETEAPKPAEEEKKNEGAVEGEIDASPFKKGFPLPCPENVKEAILLQLPAVGCRKSPFEQACSFTKATTQGCWDSLWMREFFGTTKLSKTPFLGFLVGYEPSNSKTFDLPLDLLHVGSHNPIYNDRKPAWLKAMGVKDEGANCKRPVQVSQDIQEAKVVVFTSTSKKSEQTSSSFLELGLPDNGMQVIPDETEGDSILEKHMSRNAADSQFHVVRYISPLTHSDYEFLKWSKHISKAWYLEFTLDWKGEWKKKELQEELFKTVLPSQGFVCYWAGIDNNLWRITDCMLPHYSFLTWSNAACVNAKIPEAKKLLQKMEDTFEATLKRA